MIAPRTPEGARPAIWLLALAAVLASALFVFERSERAARNVPCVVYSAAQRGMPIVLPREALPAEREAAELLSATLARAAQLPATRFPVVMEGGGQRRGLFVGATQAGGRFMSLGRIAPFDTAVGLRVMGDRAFLQSERRDAIVNAAGWLLERWAGAHWFMPGPLGEYIPSRPELILPPGEIVSFPGFISRDLAVAGDPPARAWYARNGLASRFEHGHNLVNIFKASDFMGNPQMAPVRNGARYVPGSPGDYSWQPNLLSPDAVKHAAAVTVRVFEAEPKRRDYALSVNDSIRFDESRATLAAVAPPRYFRHRPDYSNLVFKFTNEVAALVARRFPDRWLPAYAYYWCENAPDFPVAPQVVPYLTADRSQWSHPEFAAEDKALIERWRRAGPKIVGLYDYFEGSPFLCPRPTLYVVKETIPFAFRAGVRAYIAEGNPSWSLDGPKHWLAAQLLWSPRRDPAELLETYFREYWAEAAAPMREFFALCDKTWLEQTSPPLWLRFYEEEDQSFIYTEERLAELRRCVTEATRLAQDPMVRARVMFTSTGLLVTETYVAFCNARQKVSRLARPGANLWELLEMWKRYRVARSRFLETRERVAVESPFAVAPFDAMEVYLRNQPDSRAAREFMRTAPGQVLLHAEPTFLLKYLGATAAEIAKVATGTECLRDPGLNDVGAQPVGSSATYEWSALNRAWWGTGEPYEGRKVDLLPRADGQHVLRISGSRNERLGQWVDASPDTLYQARAKVRAKVSPGTAVFLILSFTDDKGKHIGLGRVDRVAVSDEVQELELCVIAKSPPDAKKIGFGLKVSGQINDDFVEFSDLSLQREAK